MNIIHIAGHLGADAEVRYTSSGKKVTSLRVATRTRRTKNDETIWWRVTLWGDQWDKLVPYLKKGSAVIVVGDLHKPEIYNDREGKPQIAMEITAVDIQFSPFGRPGGTGQSQQQQHESPAGAQQQTTPAAPFGVLQEGALNPYMGSAGKATSPQGEGQTFDDEVPF